MISRLFALQRGLRQYDSTCKDTRPDDPTHRHRWTGSGLCTDCHPKSRGTYVQAMKSLWGEIKPLSLDEALAQKFPLFRATCKHGHNSWRYVKTPLICLDCVKLARRRQHPGPHNKHMSIALPIDSSFPPGMTLEIAEALGLPLDKLY